MQILWLQINFFHILLDLRPLTLWQILSPFITSLSSSYSLHYFIKKSFQPAKTSLDHYSSTIWYCYTYLTNLQQRITMKLDFPCSIISCPDGKENYTNMHSFYATSVLSPSHPLILYAVFCHALSSFLYHKLPILSSCLITYVQSCFELGEGETEASKKEFS